MAEVQARTVVGALYGIVKQLGENGTSQLWTDLLGALWVRDYQQQPAQTWTPITPGATTFAAQAITFRALRFDAGGTVTMTVASGSITRNVQAG